MDAAKQTAADEVRVVEQKGADEAMEAEQERRVKEDETAGTPAKARRASFKILEEIKGGDLASKVLADE